MTDHGKLVNWLAPESAHEIAFGANASAGGAPSLRCLTASVPVSAVTLMTSVSASTSGDTAKPTTEAEPTLDVSILKEQARKGLVDALNSVNGAKTLVLDPTLAGPLSLVTEVALLKVWADSV